MRIFTLEEIKCLPVEELWIKLWEFQKYATCLTRVQLETKGLATIYLVEDSPASFFHGEPEKLIGLIFVFLEVVAEKTGMKLDVLLSELIAARNEKPGENNEPVNS